MNSVSDAADLEAEKRREYEEWFKLQEKEALEYSACVKYQEKIGETETEDVTESQQQSVTTTETKVKTGRIVLTVVHSLTLPLDIDSMFAGHDIDHIMPAEYSLLFSGFSYGVKQQDISHIGPKDAQLAMPPMSSSSSVFESSQSQQFSSVQQSSSSFPQSQSSQSTNQIYESQEFNGGVMKGYKMKEEFSSEQSGERNVRDSGIFTGINGDSNSLVDEEFDRKKHTVKDLAKHFALVKPKQNIPHNILPEQRIYNGDHGPALNYLGASEADGQVHSLTSTSVA